MNSGHVVAREERMMYMEKNTAANRNRTMASRCGRGAGGRGRRRRTIHLFLIIGFE
jgi:hypothetical protein